MPRALPPLDAKASNNKNGTTKSTVSSSLVETVAGFSAGTIATLAVHPFDVLKTRLQLNHQSSSQSGDSLRIFRSIIRDEGNWRGLYRGIVPNMIGNSTSWALYFLWYGNLKSLLRTYRTTNGNGHLTSLDYFVASGSSGILTAILTNPIWVIKTRMLSSSRHTPGAYRSVTHGLTHIYATEGVRGFYRGLLPSLLGVSHGAVQFMAYEELKEWRRGGVANTASESSMDVAASHGVKQQLSNWDYLTLSAASKIFAGSITYPYQVVRARLQTYDAGSTYKGARDVVVQVWRKEGVGGFYKGLAPNIVRVLPSTCVTFLVYENVKFYLPRMLDGGND